MNIAFDKIARFEPDRPCIVFVDKSRNQTHYTYEDVRLLAAAITLRLNDLGVASGDCVYIDMPNTPLFPLLILAAQYGQFAIAPVDQRLTPSEKLARQLDLDKRLPNGIALKLDEESGVELYCWAQDFLCGRVRRSDYGFSPSQNGSQLSQSLSQRTLGVQGQFRLGTNRRRADEAAAQKHHYDRLYPNDAIETATHIAERGSRVIDMDKTAIYLFTRGKSSRFKIVPLTWEKLIASASASNPVLDYDNDGVWQLVAPIHHIDGVMVIMRSYVMGTLLLMYEQFDAIDVLMDSRENGATHIMLDGKRLKEILDIQARCSDDVFSGYKRLVITGGCEASVLKKAIEYGAPVYVAFGMTETAGMIAVAEANKLFAREGFDVIDGYRVQIIRPDETGFGTLAVKGPGVFDDYLNMPSPWSVDGLFLTDDRAMLKDDKLILA